MFFWYSCYSIQACDIAGNKITPLSEYLIISNMIDKQLYSKSWVIYRFPFGALIMRSFDTLKKRIFS